MKFIIAVDYPNGSFTLRPDVLEELFRLDRDLFFDETAFPYESHWDRFLNAGAGLKVGDLVFPLNTNSFEARKDRRLLEIAAREGVENIGVGRTRLKIVDVPDDADVYLCKPDVGGESIVEQARSWS